MEAETTETTAHTSKIWYLYKPNSFNSEMESVMPTYGNIIENLTLKQKIALLADISILSDEKGAALGLPVMKTERIDKVLESHGILPQNLARSWDVSLIEKLIFNLISGEKRADLYICPSPKPYILGSNPDALSEDTYHAKELARAICKGVHASGAVSVIDDFYLNRNEINMLDETPNDRFLNEVMISPFQKLISQENNIGAIVGQDSEESSYGTVNNSFAKKIKTGLFGNKYCLTHTKNGYDTLTAIANGYILLKGSQVAIENAYSKYLSAKTAASRGELDSAELARALLEPDMLSEEKINEAVDNVLSFSFDVTAKSKSVIPAEQNLEERNYLLLNAAIGSSVLLSNKGILPLKKSAKIAIIGAAALTADGNFSKAFTDNVNRPVVGATLGYAPAGERNDKMLSNALKLAEEADVSFLFLDAGGSRSLPANQLATLDAMSANKSKTVLIVSFDDTLDMSFDDGYAAVVLSPKYNDTAAAALAQLVSGQASFSGKLSRTLYMSPDDYFKKEWLDKKRDDRKINIFLDYKRNDGNRSVAYPFGFGESLVSFGRSGFSASDKTLSLNVSNKGNTDAPYVMQIYSARSESKIARPSAELRAFAKFNVKKGTTSTAQIKVPDLMSYNSDKKVLSVESGTYTFYAADSSSDRKVKTSHYFTGANFSDDSNSKSDFVESESNIADNKYYLEAKTKDMKTCIKSRIIGVIELLSSFLLGLITLISLFFLHPIINISLIASTITLFVMSIVMFCRAAKQRRFYIEENKQASLAGAEVINVTSVKELFDREFKADFNVLSEESESEDDLLDINGVTHSDLARFKNYLATNGLFIDEASTSAFNASVLSSRLIFACGTDSDLTANLIIHFAKFSGGNCIAETVNENYLRGEKLLTVVDDDGIERFSSVKNAISRAWQNPEAPHYIIINGLAAENFEKFLVPYMQYFSNPSSGFSINAMGERLTIPSNIWFFVHYNGKPECIPVYLNEVSTYLPDIEIRSDAPENFVFEESSFKVSSMALLTKKTRNSLIDNEDLWKKLDIIESYVTDKCEYTLGNRSWIKAENYFASILKEREILINDDEATKDSELMSAMDYTLASVIMPTLYSVISDSGKDEIKNLFSELERVFGEDKTPICKLLFTKED